MRVIAAESGGRVRETVAIGRVYGDIRRGDHPLKGRTQLIDEIVKYPPYINHARFGSPDAINMDEIRDGARECLSQAVSLLERKATAEDLEDYRRFVLGLAEVVAAPPAEGGAFGIRGGRVSQSEQAALNEIAETFGDTAS